MAKSYAEQFKEKVQSMTAKEIIMAMVEGLRNPIEGNIIKIDMGSYGDSRQSVNGRYVCFGCAATRTVQQIFGIPFLDKLNFQPPSLIFGAVHHPNDADRIWVEENDFIQKFEQAINSLRQGDMYSYNYIAKHNKFAQIICNDSDDSDFHLPILTNRNYKDKEVLASYIDLANNQPQ